jgi:predicted RNA binding protein YcfA (HicA-like mRNA interferase family)
MLVRALERAGWRLARQRGSHAVLSKPGAGIVVVPMHNRDVPRGTLRAILVDAGLTADDLQGLL